MTRALTLNSNTGAIIFPSDETTRAAFKADLLQIPLHITGTQTGIAEAAALSIATEWDGTYDFIGLSLSFIRTQDNGGSLPLEIQVDYSTVFNIDYTGSVTSTGTTLSRKLATLCTAAADVGLKVEYATGAGATSGDLAQFWSTYWTAGATSQKLSSIAPDGSYVGPSVTLSNNVALLSSGVFRARSDGVITLEGWTSTTPALAFQGITSSFPAIKRSGTTLQARLADDSGYATFDGRLILQSASAPGSASDTGTAGEERWDSSYLYICTATNTWRRIAHATW